MGGERGATVTLASTGILPQLAVGNDFTVSGYFFILCN
jgi:hypothetical protein